MRTTRKIVVLEGPDGAGKSTLARRFQASGYRVVHLDRFPQVKNLARLHFEAMLPALLGYQDVVLDRAWMTERVYGEVYRRGQNRIPTAYARMLERVAARCETRVVLCLPSLDRCLETFCGRRGQEYLKDEQALCRVHHRYAELYVEGKLTSLPLGLYDYTTGADDAASATTLAHDLETSSAGRLDAPTVLVGEAPHQHTDADPLLQLPFVSFTRAGCSAWLADQLDDRTAENQLLWLNSTDPTLAQTIGSYRRERVIALGGEAAKVLSAAGLAVTAVVPHPQRAKRFNHKKPYVLLDQLEVIR